MNNGVSESNEQYITNQEDLSDLLELQKVLYSDDINRDSLQTLIQNLQKKYSLKDIDHQLILASSLDYKKIPILLPLLSNKSMENVDFIHADQEFLFHLFQINISFPISVLWEKCMEFSKLTDNDYAPPDGTEITVEGPFVFFPFGMTHHMLFPYCIPTVPIEEKLMKIYEQYPIKWVLNSSSSKREKQEIEDIIENDDLERFRTISAISDFSFNGIIIKENLLFDYSSVPILSYCIEKNAMKCFKYAFINGANPFQKSTVPIINYESWDVYLYKTGEEEIWDAFGFAGATGNIQVIKILQEKTGRLSEDLLMGCTKFHKNNIVSWILKENPSIAQFGLINSIKYENIQAIKLILENSDYKIDVNITDRFQRSPLHYAARTKLFPIAELLIKKGANVNSTDHLNNSPLNDAAKSNSKEIAQLLLENGGNWKRKPPLYHAVQFNSKEVFHLLLNSLPNLDKANDDESNNEIDNHIEWWMEAILNTAVEYNLCDFLVLLLKKDSNIHEAFFQAVWHNSKEAMKILLEESKDIFRPMRNCEREKENSPYTSAISYLKGYILAKQHYKGQCKNCFLHNRSIDEFFFFNLRSDILTPDKITNFLDDFIERSIDMIKMMLEGVDINAKDIHFKKIKLKFFMNLILSN